MYCYCVSIKRDLRVKWCQCNKVKGNRGVVVCDDVMMSCVAWEHGNRVMMS